MSSIFPPELTFISLSQTAAYAIAMGLLLITLAAIIALFVHLEKSKSS